MDYQVLVIPDPKSIIIVAITLAILYIIFKRFLYVPVSVFLQERRNLIQSQLKDARDLKSEAEELMKSQDDILSNARLQGKEIVETARKHGEELKDTIVLEAKKEAKVIIQKAEKEAEKQRLLLLEEMKDQSVDMGIFIASKIMEEQIDVDKQNYLIDKFIDEVGSSQWQN